MATFLQILGVIFLILLAAVGLAVLWMAWKAWGWLRKFKQLTASFAGVSNHLVPPFRVQLEKVARPTWD